MKELFPESWLLAHLTAMRMAGLNAIGYTIKLQGMAEWQRAEAELMAAAQRRKRDTLVATHQSNKHPTTPA